MGMAYGAKLLWKNGNIDFRSAEAKALEYGQTGVSVGTLWRVEAVRYSYVADYEAERYETTDPALELFQIPVKRWTPLGATIFITAGARDRWIDLRDGAKQWASRTPEIALGQFEIRRERQIYILQRQLDRAQRELALTKPPFLTILP